MNSQIVAHARDMGFPDRQIRMVLTSKLQSGEQLYTNLSDLVEDLSNFSDSELTDDVSSTVLPQATFLTRSSRAIDVMDSPSEVSDAQTGASLEELEYKRKCKICLDNLADMVLIPCRHICVCVTCIKNLKDCPICQTNIAIAIPFC